MKFSKDHEWVKLEGDHALIGITDYAQHQLGDVVYVDLPEIGKVLSQGDEAAVVESVKAASEVYAPVSGEVIEVNTALTNEPELVNQDPEATGWFLKLKPTALSELDGLMDKTAYDAYIAGLA